MNRRRKFQAVPNMVAAQQQQQPQSAKEKAPPATAGGETQPTQTNQQQPQQQQKETNAAEMLSAVNNGGANGSGQDEAAPIATPPKQRPSSESSAPSTAAAAAEGPRVPLNNNHHSPPSSPLQLFAETDPMLCGGGVGDGGGGGDFVQQYNNQCQQLYIDRQLQPRAYTPEEIVTRHDEMLLDQRTVVVVENMATDQQNDAEIDTATDHKEKRKAPTPKDKLVDRKRFTMSDLVKWKPKTENTLKRKWAERRRQLKEDAAGGETEAENDPKKVLSAVNKQGPSSESSAPSPAAAAGPRVMINERGEMVVDEQSLVVIEGPEQNTAGMVTVNDDLLPKRITSLSFRRKPHRSSMWGVLETDLFYEVLSATGTDFGLMHEFIPTRTRVELKNKFNREERLNPRRLNEALQNPTLLDERLRHRVERMLEQMADQ